MKKSDAALKELQAKRQETLERIAADPFMGFESFQTALEECRFTSQPEVLARLLKRENLFISGLAGSGKTTVINRFIELIDAEYNGLFNIAVTASTGIAATLIGGTTIHSWAGLGVSKEPFNSKKIDPIMWGRANNLRTCDVLIIDEVSMLPGYLFTKLDKALKYFRRNTKPFGGVQLVLIGDFLQLPPVTRREDADADSRFAIETDEWKTADFTYCFLDKSYRATDDRLKRMLLEIAAAKVSPATRELIRERQKGSKKPNTVYTTLFTTNRNVDDYNLRTLEASPEAPVKIKARAVFGDKKDLDEVYKRNNIPQELTLKVGATVLLTKNIQTPNGLLANGSLGVVEGFANGGQTPYVRFNHGGTHLISKQAYDLKKPFKATLNGKEVQYEEAVASVEQVPLKLGYAITVHKSQGQTFDGVVLDLSKVFQEGLGYVALSRVRSVDDLVITGFTEKAYDVSLKSRKITVFVKKKALVAREAAVREREMFEMLLTNELYRSMHWNIDEAASKKYAFEKKR